MLIDCISFLDPTVYGGGGEMITRRLIQAGRERGHDIRITSVRPKRTASHGRPDLRLIIDVYNHGHTFKSLGAWRAFRTDFLETSLEGVPFVHLTNAYIDVCNLPYVPCSGAAAPICPYKPFSLPRQILLKDFSNRCFGTEPLPRKLYERAALNVFASPLHESITERILGSTDLPPSFSLKPMIDTTMFRNENRQRDIEYLFVGVISEAKGLHAMRERFRDTDIHLIGKIAPGVRLDFGRHVGNVPYTEVPAWMNRAQNFVFLPRWPEPGGRVVAEAALCGCNIIGNENIGALSYDFDLADPEQYRGTEEEFWNAIENIK
jgi:glycosyltransferase involved in cell wall biosynthesis